jgi:hypothetical protein
MAELFGLRPREADAHERAFEVVTVAGLTGTKGPPLAGGGGPSLRPSSARTPRNIRALP